MQGITDKFNLKDTVRASVIFLFFIILFFLPVIMGMKFILSDSLFSFGIFLRSFQNLQEVTYANWNPYIFSGVPFIGSAFYYAYLPNWLTVFLIGSGIVPDYIAIELGVIFHIFLGALFTYLLARYLKISFWSSVISGIAFSLSGFLISKLPYASMIYSIVWLPIIFLFFHRSLDRRSWRDITISGFFLLMSALGSHVQITYYIGLFLFFYTIFFYAVNYKRGLFKKGTIFLHPLLSLGLVAIIAIGSSMIIALPILNYISSTWHGNISDPFGYALSVPHLVFNTLFPQYLGKVYFLEAFGIDWNVLETSFYMETIILILAMVSFISFKKNDNVKFFSIMALVSLLVAQGASFFLYNIFFEILPIFNNFSNPARFALLAVIPIAILAGFGADLVLEPASSDIKKKAHLYITSIFRIILGVSLGILSVTVLHGAGFIKASPFVWFSGVSPVIFATYYIVFILIILLSYLILNEWFLGKIKKTFFIGSIIFLIFLDIFFTGIRPYDIKNNIVPEDFYRKSALVDFLKDKEMPDYRIIDRDVLNDGYSLYYKIFDTGGLGAGATDYEKYTGGYFYDMGSYVKTASQNRIDLLNARYVLSKIEPEGNFKKIDEVPLLYENLDVLPRLFLVHNTETISDPEDILKRIDSPNFNPREILLLENPSPLINSSSLSLKDTAVFTYYSSDRIDIYTYSLTPSMLFLSEMYYPGWKAEIDGVSTEIYKANYLFRGLYLSQGPHIIKMVFDPEDFKMGRSITVAVLLLLLIYFIVDIIKNRNLETSF